MLHRAQKLKMRVKEVYAVNRDEIMDAIKMLSSSQGFYSRMYSSLCEMRDNDPDEFDRNMSILEE